MKHIKLFEDFNATLASEQAEFSDSILNSLCAELRKAGYKKAYYGERKKDGEMFVNVDNKNNITLFDVAENTQRKMIYRFFIKGSGYATYVEGSNDIKDVVSKLVK